MIVDLAQQQDAHRSLDTDVLIVGAGIAGLILAVRLRRASIRVAVIESGGREQVSETHPFNRVLQLGDAYSGASKGRFRCLGGTSTRWGGALIPFVDQDLSARPYLGLPGFPINPIEIRRYLPDIETVFELDSGSYEEDFVDKIAARKYIPIGDPDFKTRFAKWPAFKSRNVAVLFRTQIEADADLQVWINATAIRFELNKENGRLQSVTGGCGNDRTVTVRARHFAICAGAIESTRLLLLLDREYNGRIFEGCNALGRFFNDHISVFMARIRAKQVTKLNRMAGFRFVGTTMRSLRFELSAIAQERERIGNAFAHVSFKTEAGTGFDALREFLRSLQRSGRVSPSLLVDVLRDLPYLAKLGFWRARYNQLAWPVPATYELHVVAEQMPRADNYITLASEIDTFGLPLGAINWRVSAEDLSTFSVLKRCIDQFWTRQGLQSIGDLDWAYDAEDSSREQLSHSDVYHPGGSTRMGTNRSSAVVTSDLRLFEIPNLWVASTSVFPTGGGENPTMMLMAFTMRLADRLSGRLENERV
jgi:choline dehydrogenase-like flavoprotein